MTAAIEVQNVSKRFKISRDKHDSLKERVLKFGHRKGHEEFYALRDIDFSVGTGETMALLGHNGSGKSTLLKCVGGILRPDGRRDPYPRPGRQPPRARRRVPSRSQRARERVPERFHPRDVA